MCQPKPPVVAVCFNLVKRKNTVYRDDKRCFLFEISLQTMLKEIGCLIYCCGIFEQQDENPRNFRFKDYSISKIFLISSINHSFLF